MTLLHFSYINNKQITASEVTTEGGIEMRLLLLLLLNVLVIRSELLFLNVWLLAANVKSHLDLLSKTIF